MGKVARDYIVSRTAPSDPREARRITLAERGLIPCAPDFAKIAEGCHISLEYGDIEDNGTWVPAWFLAAWTAYTQSGARADSFGIPTEEFKKYVDTVRGNIREQIVLVGELQMTKHGHGAETVSGITSWLRRYANDL